MRIHRTDVRNVNFEQFRGNLLRNCIDCLNLTPLYHYWKVYCLKFRKISSWWLLFIVERILGANCATVSWLSQNSAFSWLDSRFKIQKYVNVRQKFFKDIVADNTMLTLGRNNGLLVCVSFGSPSYRYLSFLFHSFDDGRWDEQNNNETITECVIITMKVTILLRSLSPWHTLGFQWRYMYWYRYMICDVISLFHDTLPSISSTTNETITEYWVVISG